jgi:hypothetical protein
VGLRHFYIHDENGDVELELAVEKKSWSLDEKMNARGILYANILDRGEAFYASSASIICGREITFYEDTTYHWGGVLRNITSIREKEKGRLIYSVAIEDYCALTDRPVVKGVWEDTTLEEIVHALIDTYFSTSGISAGIIDAPATVNRIVINYLKGNAALDHLAGFGNYVWRVDKDKLLHFYDLSSAFRPVNLTALTGEKQFEMHRSNGNYRNKQWFKGNKKKTVYQENKNVTPTPDGEVREFFSTFPIAEEPLIEVYTGGAWVIQTVGLKGPTTGRQFYWNYNDTQITQDESETALDAGSGEAIRISYYGLMPIYGVVQSTTEIARRGYTEENFVNNDKLYSSIDALRYAAQLLTKYANDGDSASFILRSKDYEVGEQFTLTKAAPWNYSEEVLVERCKWVPVSPTEIEYNYKVLDGASLGGWEEFFKNLMQIEHIEIDTDEILLYLQSIDEPLEQAGTYDFTMLTPLFPDTDVYPDDSPPLYPGEIDDTDSVSD